MGQEGRRVHHGRAPLAESPGGGEVRGAEATPGDPDGPAGTRHQAKTAAGGGGELAEDDGGDGGGDRGGDRQGDPHAASSSSFSGGLSACRNALL